MSMVFERMRQKEGGSSSRMISSFENPFDR